MNSPLIRSRSITLGFMLLSACTTLGTNVSGDFVCKAPRGGCSPTKVIDSGAVGAISNSAYIPSAGTSAKLPTSVVNANWADQVIGSYGLVSSERSREQVVQVDFPSYVDASGVLHDATAVHVVVSAPIWQKSHGDAVATASYNSDILPASFNPDPAMGTDLTGKGAVAGTQEDLTPLSPTLAPQPQILSQSAELALPKKSYYRPYRSRSTYRHRRTCGKTCPIRFQPGAAAQSPAVPAVPASALQASPASPQPLQPEQALLTPRLPDSPLLPFPPSAPPSSAHLSPARLGAVETIKLQSSLQSLHTVADVTALKSRVEPDLVNGPVKSGQQ